MRKSILYAAAFTVLMAPAVAQDFKTFKTSDAVPKENEVAQINCIKNNLGFGKPDDVFRLCLSEAFDREANIDHVVTLSGRIYDIVYDWANAKQANIDGLFNPNTVILACARNASPKTPAEACIIQAAGVAVGKVLREINRHPQRMAARASLTEALTDAMK